MCLGAQKAVLCRARYIKNREKINIYDTPGGGVKAAQPDGQREFLTYTVLCII